MLHHCTNRYQPKLLNYRKAMAVRVASRWLWGTADTVFCPQPTCRPPSSAEWAGEKGRFGAGRKTAPATVCSPSAPRISAHSCGRPPGSVRTRVVGPHCHGALCATLAEAAPHAPHHHIATRTTRDVAWAAASHHTAVLLCRRQIGRFWTLWEASMGMSASIWRVRLPPFCL